MQKNKEGISITTLKKVPEILLYTLFARYLETKKEGGIINDPKSVEILESLNFDFDKIKLNGIEQIGTVCRTLIFDEQIIKFLAKNSNAVIVNLGCGLDTRFDRIDNGKLIWFDLDLPECIEIRKNFFKETDRHKFIGKSALDFSWVSVIPKAKKTLFIAEGLTMYFNESEIRSLLLTIKKYFPGAEFIFDAFHPFLVKMIQKNSRKGLGEKVAPLVKWGIKKGQYFDTWLNENIFIDEWFVADKHTAKYPLIYRVLFVILPLSRKLNKVIHLRI
jgi:O-methyltransferase involved in polyketide biosynthesis